jgi:hypothetical protein
MPTECSRSRAGSEGPGDLDGGADARHGHKTSARGFDGYKGHVAVDPDSEIVTATTVTAANAGEVGPAADLLAPDLPGRSGEDRDGGTTSAGNDSGDDDTGVGGNVDPGAAGAAVDVGATADSDTKPDAAQQLAVYGDAAYGAGLLATLESVGAQIMTKVQPPPAQGGRFSKDRFTIDLAAATVTSPGQVTVAIRPGKTGGGTAAFRAACTCCPLAAHCTTSDAGRTVAITAFEGATGPCPGCSGRPRLAGRLHRDPAEGGAATTKRQGGATASAVTTSTRFIPDSATGTSSKPTPPQRCIDQLGGDTVTAARTGLPLSAHMAAVSPGRRRHRPTAAAGMDLGHGIRTRDGGGAPRRHFPRHL